MPRYLVFGKVTLAAGSRSLAEQAADQGAQGFAQQPGFENVIFALNEDRNEYTAVSIWESREAAESGVAAITPQFKQAFADRMQGEIENHIYEIYEHKR